MSLSQTDREDLIYAKRLLEHPGLAVTLVNLVGVPLEKGLPGRMVRNSPEDQ